MARILDTIPSFEAFAKQAALENPVIREIMWRDHYEAAHPDVFKAFYEGHGEQAGMHAVVREISRVRDRVGDAAPAVKEIIEEVEPAVQNLLGAGDLAEPLHVLMVGTLTVNAFAGRLGDDVALFHCLEWFQDRGPHRVLIAHEDAHAWHELALTETQPDDLLWTTFYEGLAIRASRVVVPDRPEEDYFWYGHPGFEEWLPWCLEHKDELIESFGKSFDQEGALDAFFGSGFIEGHWRTGYFIADALMERIDTPLDKQIRMSLEEGRATIRTALGLE